ncbi:MAG: hypothetical protein ACKVTZ_13660 [Bacteroidia bacterium]
MRDNKKLKINYQVGEYAVRQAISYLSHIFIAIHSSHEEDILMSHAYIIPLKNIAEKISMPFFNNKVNLLLRDTYALKEASFVSSEREIAKIKQNISLFFYPPQKIIVTKEDFQSPILILDTLLNATTVLLFEQDYAHKNTHVKEILFRLHGVLIFCKADIEAYFRTPDEQQAFHEMAMRFGKKMQSSVSDID